MGFHEEFWDKLLSEDEAAIRQEYDDLWQKAGAGPISKEQAERTLDLLFKRSHLDLHAKGLGDVYPTEQGGPWGKLAQAEHLWWVDHATAGVNGWGTLSWFSSKKRDHTRKFDTESDARAHYGSRKEGAKVFEKSGKWYVTWKGYAGAVTHFVNFFNGTPFYVVKIKHCCWGEPRRNRDGIHIEMVNPMVCRLKNNRWHFWAGPIPQKLLDAGLTPVEVEPPFRGAKTMMPYTWSQVVTNIKLKRLCIAATGRMDRDRMSHHTDWRKTKFDMGPMWPRQLIDDAAFDTMPIEEYDFIKHFVVAENADDVVDLAELKAIETGVYDNYDMDDQTPADEIDIDSTVALQNALIVLYGAAALPQFGADGDLGPETTKAVKHFQTNWNKNQPADQLLVDGIPGVQTCGRLEKAVAMGQRFVVTAIN
jgi:hypothetical protein